MHKNSSQFSSKLKDCIPLQLSCKLMWNWNVYATILIRTVKTSQGNQRSHRMQPQNGV